MEKELLDQILDVIQPGFKGKHYQVTDKYAKPIISLYLIKNDLQEIGRCITLAEEYLDKNSTLVSALWKNAIITYGKLFTKSNEGYTSLEKKECIKKDRFKLHEEIIGLRNSFIAHRGKNEVEKSIVLVNEKSENGKVSFEFSIPTALLSGHLINEISEFKQLLIDLEAIVDAKLTKKLNGIDKMFWNHLLQNRLKNKSEKV